MGRKCVFDALRYGRQNAIASETLAQALGFRSVRELQKQVERERAAGAVILSDTHGGGYYLSNDPAELRRFTRTLYARARNTMKAAESAQRALDAATGQQRIPGWFAHNSEENEKKPPSGGRSPEDGNANNDMGSINDSGILPQKESLCNDGD